MLNFKLLHLTELYNIKFTGNLNEENSIVNKLTAFQIDSTETTGSSICDTEPSFGRKFKKRKIEYLKFESKEKGVEIEDNDDKEKLNINGHFFAESEQPATKDLRFINGVHRAGYDAFMTGYCMAYFAMKCGDWQKEENEELFYAKDFINKISLSGKDYPLMIQCSEYSKTSTYHNKKFSSLF